MHHAVVLHHHTIKFLLQQHGYSLNTSWKRGIVVYRHTKNLCFEYNTMFINHKDITRLFKHVMLFAIMSKVIKMINTSINSFIR